ncbi:hypothetical protein M2281_005783 [Mesorhizobium soli]|uniref:hypothetical protein n=1 Tax=Pseudaminobacter soli (ex Li et al. 2025) TaxID=1295366 RepID=UPI002474D06C|nr:hypothetical protein [Mesorhizobium soli]MDH6235161.1 hypothetical protein [Mesorhizobium soli]
MSDAIQKQKGPASAATDPDRGSSKPLGDKQMNVQTNTTAAPAAPDFPIPYCMQGPLDDLRDALALLSLFDRFLDEGWQKGITKEAVAALSVAFSKATDNVKLVTAFLHADDRDGTLDLYRRVRREQISKCYERGMA